MMTTGMKTGTLTRALDPACTDNISKVAACRAIVREVGVQAGVNAQAAVSSSVAVVPLSMLGSMIEKSLIHCGRQPMGMMMTKQALIS